MIGKQEHRQEELFVAGSLSSLIPNTSVREHYKAQYSKYLYHSNVCTVSLSVVCAVQDKVTCRRVLQYCAGDHIGVPVPDSVTT